MSATAERGSSATTRNRPITCTVCGLKLRGAAAPLLARGLPEHCGLPMQWASAEDAARFLDAAELRDNEAFNDAEAAYDRRLAREAHSHGLGQVRRAKQCGSCRKFLAASYRGACPHCGAKNGQRDGDWGW